MHQIEINALQLELFQAGFNRLLTVELIVIPQLGGHENIVTRDVSFLQRLTDTFLILIDRSGIDRTIADLQRFYCRLAGIIDARLPDT